MPIIEQLDELILARQRFAHVYKRYFSTIRTALPLAAVALRISRLRGGHVERG